MNKGAVVRNSVLLMNILAISFSSVAVSLIFKSHQKHKWIPVSERLPEQEGTYLCSARMYDDVDFKTKTLEYGWPANDWAKENQPGRVFEKEYAFGEM